MTPTSKAINRVDRIEDPSLSALGRRWIWAFSIGIVAVYLLLFVIYLRRGGPRDADQFLVFHSLQYWNAQLFGLAKQWTPLMCSGLSLAGEPQVPFMSLSMLLSYEVGPLYGLKLATLIYFIVGWVGAYLYAGLWLPWPAQRSLAASLFIGNGFFICRLGYGHIDFIPFLILPLLLWPLHRVLAKPKGCGVWPSAVRQWLVVLWMGAAIAVAVDGSPVAIIHLLFWVGLYAVVLSLSARSVVPLVLFFCATCVAAVLDAGYLWPMIESQATFPRHTADSFTSALSLVWFALLPVRGKLLPANGNGHELSVFIGPVLAWLIWRYRHGLATSLPRTMRHPLVVVSIVSIVLGMGSLKSLHVPTWLSPFDLLRPLPGFRSLGVTGRYWGFLALPLSLLGAAALCKFVSDSADGSKLRRWLGVALVLQLGFQTETIAAHWSNTQIYRSPVIGTAFRSGDQQVEYLENGRRRFQGEFIAPARAAIQCYNMDDFIRAQVDPGKQLVRRVVRNASVVRDRTIVKASFVSWSHIKVQLDRSALMTTQPSAEPSRLKIILNQAFHPLWRAKDCEVQNSRRGNLVLLCDESRLRAAPIDLVFDDELSRQASAVSRQAWMLWLVGAGGLTLLTLLWIWRHRVRTRTRQPDALPAPASASPLRSTVLSEI